jgi:phenol 2-monooxygenase (NADPH)
LFSFQGRADVFPGERHDKQNGPMYGRASTLYPRSLEMLDQLDLLDEINQLGFVARNSVTFDKNGKRVTSRGWHTIFEKTHGTFQDYLLNIRLKYSEGVFTIAYERLGRRVLVGWTLKDLVINENEEEDYRVTSVIQKIGSGER